MKTAESIDSIISYEQRRLRAPAYLQQQAPSTNDRANRAMDRFAVGEDEAFVTLYQSLAPRIYRYLLRRTHDRAHAEDLMQQTMLQIHRKRAFFSRGAEVAPWAFTIARRFLIDSVRKHRRQAERDGWLKQAVPATQPGGDELLEAKQIAQALARELSKLPQQQRVVFQMIKIDGLSLREAAEQLGTSVNAVKLRAHRAYVALRESVDARRLDLAA